MFAGNAFLGNLFLVLFLPPVGKWADPGGTAIRYCNTGPTRGESGASP